jgi:hypothetical protein
MAKKRKGAAPTRHSKRIKTNNADAEGDPADTPTIGAEATKFEVSIINPHDAVKLERQ